MDRKEEEKGRIHACFWWEVANYEYLHLVGVHAFLLPTAATISRNGLTHTIAAHDSHVARSRQWIWHGGTVTLSVVD